MNKVLIIENELNIRELLHYHLKRDGYHVIEAEDGLQGMNFSMKENPDLVLLDIVLPGKSGFDICRDLRNQNFKMPIMILTAKNDISDKVKILEFGADDYISKPFDIHELMARIKALLRRSSKSYEINQFRKEALWINAESHEVRFNDKIIDLSRKEFELLKALAENRGMVMSREQLLAKVWGMNYDGETRTVDVHIRYLRKKLGEKEINKKYIQTVRGLGYKMP